MPPEPIFTRFARTYDRITVDVTARYFEDVLLEEVKDFDGWGVDVDLTFPLGERTQLQLILPAYTEGTAEQNQWHFPVDIQGYGGIFEYPTLVLQRQFLSQESTALFNLSGAVGFGYVLDPLEAEVHGVHHDRFSHGGIKVRLGVLADRHLGPFTVLGNLHTDLFSDTDDLNPSSGDASFHFLQARGAVLFHGFFLPVTPAVELLYTDDLEDYHNASIVPELMLSIAERVDLKLGVPLRFSGRGEKTGIRFQVTGRF